MEATVYHIKREATGITVTPPPDATPADRKRIRERGEGFMISCTSEVALCRTLSLYLE